MSIDANNIPPKQAPEKPDPIVLAVTSGDHGTKRPISLRDAIAISVSESEEIENLGLSAHHLTDLSIELARYLMVNGALLIYGGDLRSGGYTNLFAELSYQYRALEDKKVRFRNYFSFPASVGLSVAVMADLRSKQVEPIVLDVPTALGKIDTEKVYLPNENIEDRYIIAECLSAMRHRIAEDAAIRIAVGGKRKGYQGYFPGIVEEILYTLELDKPVYLLGGFGGATRSVISVIEGGVPEELTDQYQYDTDFLRSFKTAVSSKSSVNLEYAPLVAELQKNTIDKISKTNGLTAEENRVLFQTINIHEAIFLIIKGLHSISKSS